MRIIITTLLKYLQDNPNVNIIDVKVDIGKNECSYILSNGKTLISNITKKVERAIAAKV